MTWLPLVTALAGVGAAWSQSPASSPSERSHVQHPSGPVVILGASYAEGWTLTLPGIPVLNRGVTGQQTFELAARFDADVASVRPRAVIVWGFINDVFRAPPDQVDAAIARARRSTEDIVGMARRAGIEPILATEVTLRTAAVTWRETASSWLGWIRGRISYREQMNQHVLATNAWLREFARREGLLLLDLQPVVSDLRNGRSPAYAAADGSHISPAGYQKLTEYAAPILRRHFARTGD